MKKVEEVMIDSPKSCEKHDTLQVVANQMSQSNIGSLPVVDENKKVVGIITDRDICLAFGKMPIPPVDNHPTVQEAMTEKVHSCTPDDNVSTALRIMRTKRVSRIPVVDEEKRLKGILTLKSIVRHIHESNEITEYEFLGKENVIKTIHALAIRNNRNEYVEF